MRIGMIASVPIPPAEGLGSYVWNLSRFLVERGHQVQIITRAEPGTPSCQDLDGIQVWRPRFYPLYPFHVHLHRFFVQRVVSRLERQADLFHLHTPLPPPIESRRPYVVTVHTPMLAEARVIPVQDLRSALIRLQIPISAGMERKLLAGAGRIAVVARSVAEELQLYGVDRDRIQVLGNAVDTRFFQPGCQDGASTSRPTFILAAGRLDVRKGFEDLIQAMPTVVQRFPDVQLWIAGEGPLEPQLRARADQLGLGRAVRLLGHVGRADLLGLYRTAALFAHAAHYEGLPTVLLEALACEAAVVATAVSGALDVIDDGVNGLLVPPRAPAGLASALGRLLGDPALRNRLGAAGRRTVEARFSWQAVGAGYLRLYRELLDGDDR